MCCRCGILQLVASRDSKGVTHMLYVALFIVITVAGIVAIASVARAIENAKIATRRASASHAYLTNNRYGKFDK